MGKKKKSINPFFFFGFLDRSRILKKIKSGISHGGPTRKGRAETVHVGEWRSSLAASFLVVAYLWQSWHRMRERDREREERHELPPGYNNRGLE